jgi:hypothetical protein
MANLFRRRDRRIVLSSLIHFRSNDLDHCQALVMYTERFRFQLPDPYYNLMTRFEYLWKKSG